MQAALKRCRYIYFISHNMQPIQTVKIKEIKKGNQAYSDYRHVLANILRSRYVARKPPLEARSPGRCSNVENASVTRQFLISNVRSPRIN